MLNIHSDLVQKEMAALGPNAFCVLLAISSHISPLKRDCFPSRARIKKMTGLGDEAVRNAISKLSEGGFLETNQGRKSGAFERMTYTVNTPLIGVFIQVNQIEVADESPGGGEPNAADRLCGEPDAADPLLSISKEGSIGKEKSLTPLTPTSGGADDQPTTTIKKAKATKKAGAACAAATEADFSNFANPELALAIWSTWVDYKRQQKGFTYKSDVAQAAAITKLFNCSGGSIQKARAVIGDSMANGYSGFFPYKDEMAASVRPDQIAAPITEDTFHLEPDMLERYASTTKWFYTKCPACTGIRWLSKKEFLSVMERSRDLIPEMWYTKCPEEDFNGHVTKSITSLNAAPRWEKEKWSSIFEWLRHDLHIRIFGKKDNQ